jgi:probable poly-beta-1,6-N-acetyl-D-glucosamine export protein
MARKLLYLNGLAIIAVILFHTAGTGFTAMFAWGHRYLPESLPVMSQVGSLSYYWLRFFEQLAVFSIPAFLFVSGFFVAVATGRRETINWKAVLSRSRSLIVPYLIWSTIAIALLMLEGNRYGVFELFRVYLTGGANPVLYFVPLLVQFYLLAPFLVRLARKNWKLFLLMAGLLQFAVQALQYPVFLGLDIPNASQLAGYVPKWLFLARIFWFPLGIVIAFNIEVVKSWLEQNRSWLLIATVALIPLGMLEWELYYRWSGEQWLAHRETFIDSIYSLTAIFSLLAINTKRLPKLNTISLVGSKSFGIYLVHALVIGYTARVLYHIAPAILGYQIILQPLLIIVGLGIPILMMSIADRHPIRRGYAYLFG